MVGSAVQPCRGKNYMCQEEAGGPDVVLRLKVLRRSKSLSYKEGISISHCFIHQEKPVW